MDHRSGDGWSSGWFIIFHHYEAFQCRILKYLMRRLLQRWTESSVILTSKEELVWRNKKRRSRTVSFASSRLLTWSTNICGSLEPTILSRSMPTCSPSVFEMTIFRNSTQNGTEFLLSMTKIPLDDILEECTNWKYQCLRISRPWSTEQDLRNKNFGARNGNYDENAVAPWLRIREQNVYKEFLEIAGNGSSTGSVLGETIALSVTILKSVEKRHNRIRLRILSCSRMSEKHREPEVPGEEVPVVECFDGIARIASKELATTRSVKSGTFQNACSARPRVVCLEKKLICTRQVDEQPTKRSKKNDNKCSSYVDEEWLAWQCTGTCYRLSWMSRWITVTWMKNVIKSWNEYPTGRRSSNERQLGCVFQDMKQPKCLLRKSSDMQRPIQRVKFTKALARHTKIQNQNPSLGFFCPSEPHQRTSNAPKFEDRPQKETEWQEWCAREAAWKLAKSVFKN